MSKSTPERVKSRDHQDDDLILLMIIPGVSYYSAFMIHSEIGDINQLLDCNILC